MRKGGRSSQGRPCQRTGITENAEEGRCLVHCCCCCCCFSNAPPPPPPPPRAPEPPQLPAGHWQLLDGPGQHEPGLHPAALHLLDPLLHRHLALELQQPGQPRMVLAVVLLRGHREGIDEVAQEGQATSPKESTIPARKG